MGEIFDIRVDENNVGVIAFDIKGAPVNTWVTEAFAEFGEILTKLEGMKNLRGAIFISGKPNTFIAGANLKQIQEMKSHAEVRGLIDLFHDSFARLHALPYPTIAAIHGHCLGGGLEFALACQARIAKEGKTTLIGLPECNVGLFPGGGGTQRLPRLIGYKAIELILKATMLSAKQSFDIGIVDRLIPAEEDLLKAAKELLQKVIEGKAALKRPSFNFADVEAIVAKAREDAIKVARGRRLPGPMFALDSICEGLKGPIEKGLAIEKENFVKVAMTTEAKGSINHFFLKGMTDKPKALMTKGFVPKVIGKIGVLGFGTMGRGIVIDLLRNTKWPVVVKDIPEALEPGKEFVRNILNGLAEKKKVSEPVEVVMKRLEVVSEYGDSFREVDAVIEAVFEDLKVKEQVYRDLSAIVRSDCIIASNTSSIPITAMAKYVDRPVRFGGLHFFSPVWLMQLTEVIRGEGTSQQTVDNLLNLCGQIQKRPIVCRDYPGFVVNSLLLTEIMAALRFIEEGVTIENVDQAMTRFGMPVGPIRLIDEIGIDVIHKIFVSMGISQETLKNVVASGRFGFKKSGKGFFLKDGSVDPGVIPLIAKKQRRDASEVDIQTELMSVMVKKAHEILRGKVVDDPRTIDVGILWGIGFPAYLGGLLYWSDITGLSEKLFGTKFY